MESKRKANGASADADDRSSKRRKVADFDLSKGESNESTTVYGLAFLEQIRRTADKSGRLVATYFEKLLPRESNAEYYKKTRLPISLKTIEKKLHDGDFKNLAELESYFKRMISNAKDFYPRSSPIFDDAERVRKALSNYMTKTNPAYNTRGYQAVPTPLPPEKEEIEEEEEEEEEEEDGEGEEEEGEEEGEGEEEEEEEEGDEDAEGEEEIAPVDEENDEDAEGEEEEPEEEEDDEEEEEPRSRRKAIILKRRGPGRPPKSAAPSTRPDHEYENLPYKGLTFQQAQEKIVEELLRHQEPDYDEAYFEPFINLPPRALRDYYKVISDPLSLKKLQKSIKGIQGRGNPTNVSEFKSWSAFEEKSKLLWTNAYFYNEEGSEIYVLAQDLEKQFYVQFKKAQTVVSEPAQPKIKLKVGQAAETPTASKKITIHVGGRGGSVESPAPPAAAPSTASTNGTAKANGTAASSSSNLDAARSVSASAPSPTPSGQTGVKAEESTRASPAGAANTPGTTPGQTQTQVTAVKPPIPPIPSQPVQNNPLAAGYVEQRRFRPSGKGLDNALISKLRIHTHPMLQSDRPTVLTVLPNAKEMQQSATINLPPNQNRIFIVATLPQFLQDRQYSLWALLDKQPLKQCPAPIPNQQPQERAFDVVLHSGLNIIEAHLIAAIPRSEREPGGPEVELEVFTVLINVTRI